MPHACRRCFVPYGLRFEEIFADFWSPCSICESRTHTTSTKGKCMKMHENQRFFRKSKSLTCPPSLPLAYKQKSEKIRRKYAVQSQCHADAQNWNREIEDFHRNHPKVHQNHRSRDAVWVRLSQIEQESAKISRTHALGSNTEMSARDVVKVDEIEHRNSQNAQSGSSWTSTFIHFGNEFSIRNDRTRTKGSILDIKEGPHVNFQGSSPSS